MTVKNGANPQSLPNLSQDTFYHGAVHRAPALKTSVPRQGFRHRIKRSQPLSRDRICYREQHLVRLFDPGLGSQSQVASQVDTCPDDG
jgi:hypothetical protein